MSRELPNYLPNKQAVLFQMGDGVRHLEVFNDSETGGFHPIAVVQLSDRGTASVEGSKDYELNGTYPVIAYEQIQNLEGKLLTILDASLPEGQQLKAIKNLVQNSLHGWYDQEVTVSHMWADQLNK